MVNANQLLQSKDLDNVLIADLLYRKTGEDDQQLHLGELTINEILSHDKLFDSDLQPSANSSRYYDDLNLMRVVTQTPQKQLL